MTLTTTNTGCSSRHLVLRPYCYCASPPLFRHFSLPIQRQSYNQNLGLLANVRRGRELYGQITGGSIGGENIHGAGKRAITALSLSTSPPPWDDKPYEVLANGKIAYLDEQDVLSFLDPPKALIPLDPSSYNAAAYLWKKVEDIPVERRHRLLSLLTPKLVSRAWEIAGTRYEDPKLAKKSASNLLFEGDHAISLEFWFCRTSGGPISLAWANFFRKAIFCSGDGERYGRLIGGSILAGISKSLCPLYFKVRPLSEVMSTEQPCDLAYEFGDGLWDINNYPQSFPKAAKHPWPFNDQVVIYVRHLGPGVLVGQAWQEGEALEQLPKKLCSEILMVKEYNASSEHQ